jgi:hypothetical protein
MALAQFFALNESNGAIGKSLLSGIDGIPAFIRAALASEMTPSHGTLTKLWPIK